MPLNRGRKLDSSITMYNCKLLLVALQQRKRSCDAHRSVESRWLIVTLAKRYVTLFHLYKYIAKIMNMMQGFYLLIPHSLPGSVDDLSSAYNSITRSCDLSPSVLLSDSRFIGSSSRPIELETACKGLRCPLETELHSDKLHKF